MTILTDSIAREHADSLRASAEAARRARESRRRSRDARRAERARRAQGGTTADSTAHGTAATVRHGAARPFVAMRAWLVAGQL